MIFGDPYKFAILTDVVDKWCSPGFISGVFKISIDGSVFPKGLLNTTLNSELYLFFERGCSAMITKPVNSKLFYTEKVMAYKILYKTAFPELDDWGGDSSINNYQYSCSFNEMEGEGCYLFLVSNGESVRLLGAQVFDGFMGNCDEVLKKHIHEVIMPIPELDDIIRQLRVYYDAYIDIK